MINRKELAICKRRGHDPEGHRDKWELCKYCGMWTRTVSVQEESETEPPEKEQDPMYAIRREFGNLQRIAAGNPPKGRKKK